MEYVIMNKSEHIKIAKRFNPPRACYGLGLMQDLDFLCLSKDQKLLLFALYAMAATYDNKLPLNLNLIKSVAGPDVTKEDIKLLQGLEFISITDEKISFPEDAPKTKTTLPTVPPELKLVMPRVYPDWLNMAAWNDFVQHRKEIKKPLTDLSISMNLKVLEAQPEHQREIINTTIAQRWTGLFAHKGGQKDENDWYSDTINNAFGDKD